MATTGPQTETGNPDLEGPITPVHGSTVRYFHVGAGFDLSKLMPELREYTNILLGREPAPIDKGVLTLMELAEAYHARAKEIEMELLDAEAAGAILRGSRAYRFRTGPLRSFIEMCAKSTELGSRRVTHTVAVSEGKA